MGDFIGYGCLVDVGSDVGGVYMSGGGVFV